MLFKKKKSIEHVHVWTNWSEPFGVKKVNYYTGSENVYIETYQSRVCKECLLVDLVKICSGELVKKEV